MVFTDFTAIFFLQSAEVLGAAHFGGSDLTSALSELVVN